MKNNHRVLFTAKLPRKAIALLRSTGVAFHEQLFVTTEVFYSSAIAAATVLAQSKPKVFTSVNAVTGFVQNMPEGLICGNTIFCLEGKTEAHLRRLEATRHCRFVCAHNAEALANLIVAQGVPQVHFFCGDKHLKTLPETLAEANIKLHKHVVYRTVLNGEKAPEDFSCIAFFSPSAVESFLQQNTIPETAKVFCIGTTTAAALPPHPSENIFLAPRHDKLAVAETIIDHIKQL